MSAGLLAFQQHCELLGWETKLGDRDRYLYFQGAVTSEIARAFTDEISRTDLPKIMSFHFDFTCDDLQVMLPVYSVFVPNTDWPRDFPAWLQKQQPFHNMKRLQINNLCQLFEPGELQQVRAMFPNLKCLYFQFRREDQKKSTLEDVKAAFPDVKVIA